MDQFKERFLKAYSNIPMQLRDDVILLLDQKLKVVGTEFKTPLTWNVAYLEVKQDTELSKKILNELASLDLI
jgi:hypothetical protein